MTERPKKLKFGLLESHTHSVWYDSMTINVSDYPELDGMSKEEMISYINENFWDMKSMEDEDYTLLDDLQNMGDVNDKIYDEQKELYFEELDEDDEDDEEEEE
ncbi:hypothetical protein CCP3SC1AL1_300018 [Gammaproteobacteria bacterium]